MRAPVWIFFLISLVALSGLHVSNAAVVWHFEIDYRWVDTENLSWEAKGELTHVIDCAPFWDVTEMVQVLPGVMGQSLTVKVDYTLARVLILRGNNETLESWMLTCPLDGVTLVPLNTSAEVDTTRASSDLEPAFHNGWLGWDKTTLQRAPTLELIFNKKLPDGVPTCVDSAFYSAPGDVIGHYPFTGRLHSAVYGFNIIEGGLDFEYTHTTRAIIAGTTWDLSTAFFTDGEGLQGTKKCGYTASYHWARYFAYGIEAPFTAWEPSQRTGVGHWAGGLYRCDAPDANDCKEQKWGDKWMWQV